MKPVNDRFKDYYSVVLHSWYLRPGSKQFVVSLIHTLAAIQNQMAMNEQVKHIVESLLTEAKVLTEEEIAAIVSQFPFSFPASYIDVIRFVNGYEGDIGPDSWIYLFPVEDLGEVNNDYKISMEDIPDYFLIGKDAADTGYAFHKVQGTFHSFGLMSNFETDFIYFMGHDFYEFLETLYNYRFKT